MAYKVKLEDSLEDNTGENIGDLGSDDVFLNTTLKAWSMETWISWTLLKFKFFSAKYIVWRIRRKATDWKLIFAKDISDEGLLPKTCKNS